MTKLVFVVRDTGLGGINSVVKQLASLSEDKTKEIYIVSLSKNTQVNVYQGITDNMKYFPLLSTLTGLLVRLGNKLFPYLFCSLFSLSNTKALLKYISDEIGDDVRIYLCGFGAFSLFEPEIDSRVTIVSHSINSEMIKTRCPRILQNINKYNLKRLAPNKFICVSTAIKNDWLNLLGSKITHIEVINNPLQLEVKDIKACDLGFKYFIICGRLSPEKNLFNMIDTYLSAELTEHKLILLGSGPLSNELEKYILDRNATNEVILLGYCDDPYSYIKGSDGLLLNSLYEGLPTVALEAMALNTPLIIGECAGAAYDVVPNDKHHLIFKTKDLNTFKNRIIQASRGVYPIFDFQKEKYKVKEILRRYEDF